MPLLKRYDNSNSEIIIWNITETYSYFIEKLDIEESQLLILKTFTPKRLIEWLLPRYLISAVLGFNISSYRKDEFGKPYIKGSDKHISISHSSNYFTIIYSNLICGIDIQCFNKKIEKISRKFINQYETKWISTLDDLNESYHTIWSAKEAVYKAYGRKSISFKDHIFVKKELISKSAITHLKLPDRDVFYETNNLSNTSYYLIYATETN